MSNFLIGIVKKWNGWGCYGFITYSEKGEEKSIYTHKSCLINKERLFQGDKVRFIRDTNDRGSIAKNVEVLENAKVKKNT
jgi:cold shock CspA family protein